MKNRHLFLLVAFCIGFVTNINAQHRTYRIQNGIGITGALTQYDIVTDNFETKKGNGWLFGASATVDIPNKWYNVSYSIQLSENTLEIASRESNTNTTPIFTEYKIFAAQISLLGHIKIAKNYFTIDVGPMLQYNGKLELKDDSQELYFIQGYDNLQAKDLAEISNFNANGVAGVSLGFPNFKLKAHYIYGFTNILKKLDSQNLDTSGSTETKFKGNQSMLVFGAMFSF